MRRGSGGLNRNFDHKGKEPTDLGEPQTGEETVANEQRIRHEYLTGVEADDQPRKVANIAPTDSSSYCFKDER
jgi:hypothetical protein